MSEIAHFARVRGGVKRAVQLFALVVFLLPGCTGGGSKSAGGPDDSDLIKNENFHKDPIAKFAGTVTIDGQPPKKDCTVFVILTDANHLDENSHGQLPKHFAACNAEGKFAFSTYGRFDGVPAGKYALTFVELHKVVKRAGGGKRKTGSTVPGPSKDGGGGSGGSFAFPDELKNLYADPDKHIKEPRFSLDLKPPGQEDYRFDLAVAGKETAKRPAHGIASISPRELEVPPTSVSAKN